MDIPSQPWRGFKALKTSASERQQKLLASRWCLRALPKQTQISTTTTAKPNQSGKRKKQICVKATGQVVLPETGDSTMFPDLWTSSNLLKMTFSLDKDTRQDKTNVSSVLPSRNTQPCPRVPAGQFYWNKSQIGLQSSSFIHLIEKEFAKTCFITTVDHFNKNIFIVVYISHQRNQMYITTLKGDRSNEKYEPDVPWFNTDDIWIK